jgi:hypothetical protein
LRTTQLIIFSSACADVVSPIALALGQRDTVEVTKEIRQIPWDGASSSENVKRLAESLGSLPDATEDDSYLPAYYVARALAVIAEKLNAISGETPLSAARYACNGTLDIASDFEYICGEAGEHPNLESTVESGVLRLIELLSGLTYAREDYRLVQCVQEIGLSFTNVLPTVGKIMQWDSR